ncbi:MAG: trypsin-like peptidase domain-containing protein, partial [Verrucomicrobiae bacterium]|nr:trypsin-like peptidase domain-containing protein [Verrucomicrobiae bacterium]
MAPADTVSQPPAAAVSSSTAPEDLTQPWTVKTFHAARPSVVTVKQVGDHGEVLGTGAGFAVEGGLVATCFHVIGEGRGLMLELDGGGETPVVEIAAWDEVHDLALLRPLGVSLPPLPLADHEPESGTPVLAVGNPMGLSGSVTAGLISGHRDLEGQRLLQVAIPIELGNSGGPLLDAGGRVLGLLTYKSAVTDNLGFAVPIERLQELRRHPNPVSMVRWQGMDALDADRWEIAFDGNWRSRRGALTVTCQGERHTGRTICWRREKAGAKDNEWSVWLRFDPATGGAGIALTGGDNDRHDGLFISEGKLLLVRFTGKGSDEWKPLAAVPATGWRRNAWNHLILQRSGRRYLGRLNDQLLVSVEPDEALPTQRVGLLKLGRSHADFRSLASTCASLSADDPQPVLSLAR